MRNAMAFQMTCQYIHTIPLGNSVHVQLHTRQLFYQPPSPEPDLIHTHAGPHLVYCNTVGKTVLRLHPESPKLHQRSHGNIKYTATVPVYFKLGRASCRERVCQSE